MRAGSGRLHTHGRAGVRAGVRAPQWQLAWRVACMPGGVRARLVLRQWRRMGDGRCGGRVSTRGDAPRKHQARMLRHSASGPQQAPRAQACQWPAHPARPHTSAFACAVRSVCALAQQPNLSPHTRAPCPCLLAKRAPPTHTRGLAHSALARTCGAACPAVGRVGRTCGTAPMRPPAPRPSTLAHRPPAPPAPALAHALADAAPRPPTRAAQLSRCPCGGERSE